MDYKPIQKDFETMTKETQRLVDKFNRGCKSIEKQEEAIESLKNKLTAIKNGEVVPPSIKEMETQLERNNKELEETINRINELNSIRVTTTDEDKELAKLQQARADLKDNISTLSDEIKTARTSSIEVQQLKEKLNSLNKELERTKEETSQVKKEYYESMETDSIDTFGEKVDRVGGKIDKFKNRISRLLISTMVFNVMRSGLTALRNNFVSLLKTNDQFSNSLNQIKANLMTAFTPIYNACLPAINSLMNSLSKLTGTIAVFVSGLFGKSIQETTKDAKKLSSALNKTSTSAKKASGSLGSFDTLEVIPDNNASSGTGGSSDAIDYSGEITYSEKLLNVLNKIRDAIAPIIEYIKNFQEEHGTLSTAILLVFSALTGLLILKVIKKLFTGVGSAVVGASVDFTGFFDSLGKAAETIAILGGLTLVIQSITGLIDTFSQSGLSLGEVAGLLGIVLGEVVVAFGLLMGIMTALQPSWASIAAAAVIFAGFALVLSEVTNLIKTCSETGTDLSSVGLLLGEMFLIIIGLMASIVLLGPAMTAGLIPFSILMAEICIVLGVMALTIPTILDACGRFISTIAPYLIILLDTIFTGIEKLIYALGTTLPPIIDSVGGIFNTIFSGIDKIIGTIGKSICNILNTVKSLVTTVLSAILNFINKLGPAINNFVDNAISAVTKLINFIISGIEYLVNTLVVGGTNKIIKSINSISKYVGITIPTVPDMTIPRFIPKLATGAVIPPRQEFMAILGDQKHGTNIEAPLDTIKQANREVLEEVLGRTGINGQEREIVLKNWQFILQMGNTSFGKIAIEEIKKYEKETSTQFLLA